MNKGPILTQALHDIEGKNSLTPNQNGIKQLLTVEGLLDAVTTLIQQGNTHISKKQAITLPENNSVSLHNSVFVLNNAENIPHALILGKKIAKTEKSVLKYAYDLGTGEELVFKRSILQPNLDKETKEALIREEKREISGLILHNWFRGHGTFSKNTAPQKIKKCLAFSLLPGKNVQTILQDIDRAARDGDELEDNFTDLIEIAYDICIAAEKFYQAHDGAFHRDIKPSNMMRAKRDPIIFIDLGGFILESDLENDIDNEYGTDEYMAPELRAGSRHNRATESFAVGQCLKDIIDILNGVQFQSFFNQMKRSHREDDKAYPNIKESLIKITQGLTQKDPNQRITLIQALDCFKQIAQQYPELISLKEDSTHTLENRLSTLRL